MKKTVIINISGIVFHIDEDAYEKLKAYLDSLNRYFGHSNEGKEILTDIESRIAELLQPKINTNKQSVSIEDIEEILSILGTPEDIAGSDSSSYESDENTSSSLAGKRYPKRLYRDIDNLAIGGVCSGLGAYFSVDPMIFRIIFIALIFAGGVSFIIYPILWIVLPAARTSTQKLEMRGQDVNISNIEKTVKEESNNVHNNANKPYSTRNRVQEVIHDILGFLGVLIKGIAEVMRYILGIFLILIAILFSIAAISALYFKNFSVYNNNEYFGSVQDFLYGIISPINADTLIFLAFIIAIIPIAGLIYAGLKLLIRFENNQRWIIGVFSILWILSVISFVVLVFTELDNFKSDATVKEVIPLEPSTKTFYLSSPGTSEKDEHTINFFSNSHLFLPLNQENKEEKVGIVKIDIEKTNSPTPELQIVKEARGEDHSEALRSAKTISINYSQKDSVLVVDPFFNVSNDERWKFYNAKVILRLPKGTRICIDESTKHLLYDIKNIEDYWDENMINKTWEMTEYGLELVNSSSTEVND